MVEDPINPLINSLQFIPETIFNIHIENTIKYITPNNLNIYLLHLTAKSGRLPHKGFATGHVILSFLCAN